TLTPHSMIHGDACFAYFNKIWGIPHRWAKWHSRLMAPIESRTPDWRTGFGLQTARTGLRYRNPVIERTAISRVSKSFRGDLQPGKVAMPRGPRSEKLCVPKIRFCNIGDEGRRGWAQIRCSPRAGWRDGSERPC